MQRRTFLKVVGIGSAAVVFPPPIMVGAAWAWTGITEAEPDGLYVPMGVPFAVGADDGPPQPTYPAYLPVIVRDNGG